MPEQPASTAKSMDAEPGGGSAPAPKTSSVAGFLLLVLSLLLTIVVAIVAAAWAGAATGEGLVFLVSAAGGLVLGTAWLGVTLTIAASRDMSMWIQGGLLVTCPLIPIVVTAGVVAGYGTLVAGLTVVIGILLAVAFRRA